MILLLDTTLLQMRCQSSCVMLSASRVAIVVLLSCAPTISQGLCTLFLLLLVVALATLERVAATSRFSLVEL